jgi:C-terminal processing protease CtpA/Prc
MGHANLAPMKAILYVACVLVLASGLRAESKDAGPEKEIRRLISELGAPKYAARQAAQKQLQLIGEKNHEMVLDLSIRAYATTTDPEVKGRLHSVMAGLVGAKLFDRPRGYVGIQIGLGSAFNEQQEPLAAIAVLKTLENTGAEKAGVQAGDLILKIDDFDLGKISSTTPFLEHVQSRSPGDKVKLVIKRGDDTLHIEVVLGELPEEIRAALYNEERRREFFRDWLANQLQTFQSKAKQ